MLAVFAAVLGAVFFVAFMTAGLAGAKPKNSKIVKGPSGLAFYNKKPKKMPKQHGKLIWQRNATKATQLSAASSTKTVLYTSKTAKGNIVSVSGTIAIPKGKAPRGGWPVISYGHGTTGIADKCAPSRVAVKDPTDYVSYTDDIQNSWLKAGYVVARTDYQGLGTPGIHQFLIGKPAGRSILDITRAARALNPKISKKYVIAGHSQGGHAALWAAGQAASWTPELKLKGTVAYAPASHLKEQASLLESIPVPSSLSALASMIVRGAQTASTDIKPSELIAKEPLAFYGQTKTECLERLAQPDNLGGIAPSELIREGADLDPLLDLLEDNNPAVKTAPPILLAQGEDDSTTYMFLTNILNDELVAKGDTVDYRTYEGTDHSGVLDSAADDVDAFLAEWLPSGR
ncbi:MAG: alpha/beta hydrolase family protein [Solirubrobacterales bacterium]